MRLLVQNRQTAVRIRDAYLGWVACGAGVFLQPFVGRQYLIIPMDGTDKMLENFVSRYPKLYPKSKVCLTILD